MVLTKKIKNKPQTVIIFSFIFLIAFLFAIISSISAEIIPISTVPQYNKTLSSVIFTLSIDNYNLNFHDALIKSLPEYSKIAILLPDKNISFIQEDLESKEYKDRINLITFTTESVNNLNYFLIFPEINNIIFGNTASSIIPNGSIWAQDLFIALDKNDGHKQLLISETYKWFTSFNSSSENIRLKSDNLFLNALFSSDIEINRTELTFSGGNILVDNVDNKITVFCGYDVIRKTQLVWKSIKESSVPDKTEISELIKNYFNADEVVFFGSIGSQPDLLFHLDQAMLLLNDKTVFLTNISDIAYIKDYNEDQITAILEVDNFLQEIRTTLVSMGYTILNLDTSISNILNNQFYANAIPYIDSDTGVRTILLPIFSGDEMQEELNNKNITSIIKSGYAVIPVKDSTNTIRGGIHCLINVLE